MILLQLEVKEKIMREPSLFQITLQILMKGKTSIKCASKLHRNFCDFFLEENLSPFQFLILKNELEHKAFMIFNFLDE